MTTMLADHNVRRACELLLGALEALGLTELLDLRLATFAEIGLIANSPDRDVWRRAQELDMLLLTENRKKRARIRWSKRCEMS